MLLPNLKTSRPLDTGASQAQHLTDNPSISDDVLTGDKRVCMLWVVLAGVVLGVVGLMAAGAMLAPDPMLGAMAGAGIAVALVCLAATVAVRREQ